MRFSLAASARDMKLHRHAKWDFGKRGSAEGSSESHQIELCIKVPPIYACLARWRWGVQNDPDVLCHAGRGLRQAQRGHAQLCTVTCRAR